MKKLIRCSLAMLGLCASNLMGASPVPTGKPSHYPNWWFEQDVIPRKSLMFSNPGWTSDFYRMPDNFAVANVGQLKWIASRAAIQMNRVLPGGAGNEIDDMIAAWNKTGNDVAFNQGQLKFVAQKFYDRLADNNYQGQPLSLGETYPWTQTTSDDDSRSVVNLGQLKFVFCFILPAPSGANTDSDNDGLPDYWEIHFFGDLSQNGSGDFDEDGLDNFKEFEGGCNPTCKDTDGDGMEDGYEDYYDLEPSKNELNELAPNGDPDGDGVNNIDEFRNGSMSNSATNRLSIEIIYSQPFKIQVKWFGVKGIHYQVQHSLGPVYPCIWTGVNTFVGIDQPMFADVTASFFSINNVSHEYRLVCSKISFSQNSDGDGLTDIQEYDLGTNPFFADSDGDGHADGASDYYPLNPNLHSAPSIPTSDTTPPTITLTLPTDAVLVY